MKEPRYIDDIDGNPVLASCENCQWCTDHSDGPEYGPAFYGCEKEGKEHMSNLKHFPFKTSQDCCDLSFHFLIDWNKETKNVAHHPV